MEYLIFVVLIVLISKLNTKYCNTIRDNFIKEHKGKGEIFNRQGYWCCKPKIRPKSIEKR